MLNLNNQQHMFIDNEEFCMFSCRPIKNITKFNVDNIKEMF